MSHPILTNSVLKSLDTDEIFYLNQYDVNDLNNVLLAYRHQRLSQSHLRHLHRCLNNDSKEDHITQQIRKQQNRYNESHHKYEVLLGTFTNPIVVKKWIYVMFKSSSSFPERDFSTRKHENRSLPHNFESQMVTMQTTTTTGGNRLKRRSSSHRNQSRLVRSRCSVENEVVSPQMVTMETTTGGNRLKQRSSSHRNQSRLVRSRSSVEDEVVSPQMVTMETTTTTGGNRLKQRSSSHGNQSHSVRSRSSVEDEVVSPQMMTMETTTTTGGKRLKQSSSNHGSQSHSVRSRSSVEDKVVSPQMVTMETTTGGSKYTINSFEVGTDSFIGGGFEHNDSAHAPYTILTMSKKNLCNEDNKRKERKLDGIVKIFCQSNNLTIYEELKGKRIKISCPASPIDFSEKKHVGIIMKAFFRDNVCSAATIMWQIHICSLNRIICCPSSFCEKLLSFYEENKEISIVYRGDRFNW